MTTYYEEDEMLADRPIIRPPLRFGTSSQVRTIPDPRGDRFSRDPDDLDLRAAGARRCLVKVEWQVEMQPHGADDGCPCPDAYGPYASEQAARDATQVRRVGRQPTGRILRREVGDWEVVA